MAGLATPPGFGGNRWGEVDWAKFSRLTNAPFSVASATDWLPSINTGANRTMNIAAGTGQAYGIYDVTDATETIAFAANAGGSDRYDALVARFDWTAKTRTFAVIQGTTSPPAVNASQSLDVTKINRIPGARYDALIAIVKIPPSRTIFQPGDLESDMRVWGGATGPMVSNVISTRRSMLDVPSGGQVLVSGLETIMRTAAGTLVSTMPRGLAIGVGQQTVAYDSEVSVPLTNTVISGGGVAFNASNGRVTFTEAGDYWCAATLKYLNSPFYDGWRSAGFGRNGTPLVYTWGNGYTTSANSVMVNAATVLLRFGAGDYLNVFAHHLAKDPSNGDQHSLTIDRTRSQISVTYAGA